MGDKRRNKVFCDWIVHHFPKAKSICVVADGNAELSHYLAMKGYKVRVVEPDIRNHYSHTRHRNITIDKRYFSADDDLKEDIIVGMHPDEATIEILLCAKMHKKPFAIVPCCLRVLPGREKYVRNVGTLDKWVNKLKDVAGHSVCGVVHLKISGANRLLWSKWTQI